MFYCFDNKKNGDAKQSTRRKKSEIAELQNITYISTTTKHDMHTAIVAILCCYTYLLENITRLYQQLQQLQQNFHEYPTTIQFGLVLVRLLVNEWNFE